jgi:hypothetical protein
MSGAIPPLPHTPSWHGVQLKHRDNFTFYLYHTYLHHWRHGTKCRELPLDGNRSKGAAASLACKEGTRRAALHTSQGWPALTHFRMVD